jgi:dTDP-4-amino-4,6-dideoxygalactose transaminase
MHGDVADRVRALREYGWRARHVSDVPGQCSRLDELQAAVLRVKLRALDDDNARRIELARVYTTALDAELLRLPIASATHHHVYHLFVVAVHDREAVRHQLHAGGVATAVHYPVPIHLQPAYRDRIARAPRLAESERAARDVLSLPMFPQLTRAEVEAVCAALTQRVDRRRGAVVLAARAGLRRSNTRVG